MSSTCAFGMIARRARAAEPATSSSVPTAISTGAPIAATSSRAQRLARAADAGGERPRSDSGLLGERAEGAALRIGDIGERRRLQRIGDARRAGPRRRPGGCRARRARRSARARGCLQRQKRGDARAHRVAHDVGALEPQMVDQRAHVLGHRGGVIVGRIVELASTRRGRDCRARSRGGRRAVSVATQPGWTQFTSLVDAKPCTRTIGSPSPSSR